MRRKCRRNPEGFDSSIDSTSQTGVDGPTAPVVPGCHPGRGGPEAPCRCAGVGLRHRFLPEGRSTAGRAGTRPIATGGGNAVNRLLQLTTSLFAAVLLLGADCGG